MGATPSQPASAYLTLVYDYRSVLVLRPPTLALARDKAVELFALDLGQTGQQVRLLLDGVELSDEVWGVVLDGAKLQVELTGKRRRATTEAEGEAPDRKRVVAYPTDDGSLQSKRDDHHHACDDCNWGKDDASTIEPSRDAKGKEKEKADTSTYPLTPAEMELLGGIHSSKSSFVHQPGCHHFESQSYDEDEDDQSIIIQKHTTGRQWRIPFFHGSEMTLGALLKAMEKKTGESRETWSLVTEERSELDPEREWKALSRWGIGEGSRIRLVHEGELIAFAIVLEPRNTFFVEALTTDTVGDIKKKLSFQVSTPPSDFILCNWADVEVKDDAVLGDFVGTYGPCASVSFTLWDPEEFKKYLVKKKEEERARQLRINSEASGSAMQGPAPKDDAEQSDELERANIAIEGEGSTQLVIPVPPFSPPAVVGETSAMAIKTELGEVPA